MCVLSEREEREREKSTTYMKAIVNIHLTDWIQLSDTKMNPQKKNKNIKWMLMVLYFLCLKITSVKYSLNKVLFIDSYHWVTN